VQNYCATLHVIPIKCESKSSRVRNSALIALCRALALSVNVNSGGLITKMAVFESAVVLDDFSAFELEREV
jgi:hypothetical protein